MEYIYTRNGTKCRVIHRDEEKVIAAVQIVHQVSWGDDYEEHEDDGPVWQLSPGQCFDAPPTMQVSEELVALEKRAHEVRGEIVNLGHKFKAAQKEHDEKMAALARHDDVLERLAEFLDGGITHYVIEKYGNLDVLTVEETMCEDSRHWGKSHGRLLSLVLQKASGKFTWCLNQYVDGSGSDYDVTPCTSYEEALAHLQAWVDTQAEKERYNQGVIDFAKKYDLVLPYSYIQALITKEKSVLAKSERNEKKVQREKRQELDARWKKLAAG